MSDYESDKAIGGFDYAEHRETQRILNSGSQPYGNSGGSGSSFGVGSAAAGEFSLSGLLTFILIVLSLVAVLTPTWIRGSIPYLWFYEYVTDAPRPDRMALTLLFVLSQASIIYLAYSWWSWVGAVLSVALLPYVNYLASVCGWQLAGQVELAAQVQQKIRSSFYLPSETTDAYPGFLQYGWYVEAANLYLSWMPTYISYAAITYLIMIPPIACIVLLRNLARRRT